MDRNIYATVWNLRTSDIHTMSRVLYLFFMGASLLLIPFRMPAQGKMAQDEPKGQDVAQGTKALSGTYQIIYKDSAHAEAIDGSILYRVERERDEKEVKYLVLSNFVKIKILPKAVISPGAYVPLEEFIISK
jgi:hypothetical protein